MPGLPGGDWFDPGQPDPTGFVPVAPGLVPGASQGTALELPKIRNHEISMVGGDAGDWWGEAGTNGWVKVWVPRHATLQTRIGNIWQLASRYIATGRSEYIYTVALWTLSGTLIRTAWTMRTGPSVDGPPDGGPTGLPEGWYFGPYYWGYLGMATPERPVIYPTNWLNTGTSQFFVVQFYAGRTYAGFDTTYTASLDITGGVFGIPPLRQRARADGLTADTRQEVSHDASPQRTDQWWVGKHGSW